MPKRSTLLGVGHYVPTKVVTNDDLSKMMNTTDEWIHQRTGIRERRFIEHTGIGASDLAVPAAKMAVERAGKELKDIDAIIFATLSPDVTFPGSGVFLGDKLGLNGIPALDVRNQCSGFIYSLAVADAWIRVGMYKHVLVVGGEVHSTGIDLTDHGRDVAVLFGDGAAAALVGGTDDETKGILSIKLHSDGVGASDLWLENPSSRTAPVRITHEMIEARTVFPRMNGKQVFRWATDKMPEVSHAVLKDAGISVDDIDIFVPHQANMRINQLVAMKLNIPQEKVFHNIERYGNTTAATIPLCLSELWAEGRLKPGTTVLSAAFGSGYTWAGAVYRF
jgi:3-oxoacyl-[acyl-carrier-protein] synthase-3